VLRSRSCNTVPKSLQNVFSLGGAGATSRRFLLKV
jgi:hypothetical protein